MNSPVCTGDLRIRRSAEVASNTLQKKKKKMGVKQREGKDKILSGFDKLLTVANFMPQDLHTRRDFNGKKKLYPILKVKQAIH